ncbi:sulfur carrier protein ThiS [Acidaminobacter hydrogenoformans]|uniref:Sulfur carrier protein n=1 Tax=Acidaminobacter hydrogenoformans DSM 2784 TaxID=1120920 RepID=A0A1G5S475_9FIRM|nr:sulfur carrier protein ThiS [Acidaminobacter hydrogenoformans]SCZ81165.1 sulfur carrier protein [Acidaminobacter hydrogenoformans DSM 2784]
MIMVNGKPMAWTEGMTVSSMLKEKNYVFAKIVVKINGTYVPPQLYDTSAIEDGDEVQAIHMLAGG